MVGGADAEAIAAVLLSHDDSVESEPDGVVDDLALVDEPAFQQGWGGGRPASTGRFVAGVVLDVPVVRVRQCLLEELTPVLDRAMQADQVSYVRIQPYVVEADLLDEPNGAIGSAEVGVFIKGLSISWPLGVESEYASGGKGLSG